MAQAIVVGPLLRRRPGFKRRPVHVGFVVHKVALRLFSRVLQPSPVSMIPPLLPIHSSLTGCTLSQQETAFLNKKLQIFFGNRNTGFQASQTPSEPPQHCAHPALRSYELPSSKATINASVSSYRVFTAS